MRNHNSMWQPSTCSCGQTTIMLWNPSTAEYAPYCKRCGWPEDANTARDTSPPIDEADSLRLRGLGVVWQ